MATTSSSRPRVFLDVCIGEEPVGRLTIELFTDKTPKTCENFRQLCTGEHKGLSYANSVFHRVIDEFMVQGGDIANGDGTGMTSIYNGEFEDENLDWRELDAAGLVCSANRGRDTNGSQFFVTLEPCEHLNGKHTIFGRLASGQETLNKIAKVDVDQKDRPKESVIIARCGELEKRKKPSGATESIATATRSDVDRGRPRRSDASSNDRILDESQTLDRTRRRQSDNVVDEGLRGRPRQRSSQRSNTVIESSEEDVLDSGSHSSHSSQVQKHKRKRSPSPSRHKDRRSTDEYGQRRRRSLPNQYDDDKRYRGQDERDRYRYRPRKDDEQGRNSRRNHDRYRPSRDTGRFDDRGRLSGGTRDSDYVSRTDSSEAPVIFKGRGIMKYREDRREEGRL